MGHGENFSILNETNNSEALNGMKERLSLPEVSTHEFVAKFHNKLPDLAFQCTMSEYGKSLESTIQFIASGSDSNGKPFEITSNGGLKIWPDGMFAASGIIMTDHNGTFRSLDRTDRADVLAALARGIDESKEMTYLEKRTQIMRSNGGSLFFSMNMENPYSKQIMEIAKTIAHDRVSVRNFTDITRAVPGIHLEQKDPHTVIFDTVGNKPYIASLSVNGEKQTVDAGLLMDMIVLDVKHMSRWMVESSRVGDVIVSAAKKIGISRAMVEANSITIQCMVDDFLANEYSYHGNDTADMTEKDDAIIAISERLEEHVSGKRHLGARTISDTISYPFEKLENIGLLGFTRAESMYVLESGTACDSGGQWFTTYEAVVRLRPTGKDDNKADLRRVVGVFANKDDAAFFLMRLGREHKIRNVTIG